MKDDSDNLTLPKIFTDMGYSGVGDRLSNSEVFLQMSLLVGL